MRPISKFNEPYELINFKSRRPTAKYEDLYQNVRREVKRSLIAEQKFFCCYCEDLINYNTYNPSGEQVITAHIDHFKPQSKYRNITLDYDNLFASCQSTKTCGHKKDDSELNIDLLDLSLSTRFSYEFTGEIKGRDPGAQAAIEILNLNEVNLLTHRKAQIDSSWETFLKIRRSENAIIAYFKFLKGDSPVSSSEFVRVPYSHFVYMAIRQNLYKLI